MTILGIECSATAASCAVMKDGNIIAKAFTNVKLTHSETLMPMVENMLASAKLTIDEIDCFAISNGPGSFTGIRIGISAVKGLAAAGNKPCIGVSTLEAMAEMHKNSDSIICALMDARCNQFYNAVFESKNGQIARLSQDRALLFDELSEELEAKYADKKIIAVGDGAKLFCKKAKEQNKLPNVQCAPENLLLQQADGVVMLADEYCKNGQTITEEELLPFYLRLPQAERELKSRKEEKK